MKKPVLLLAALLLTTVGSAVGQDVSFNFDKSTAFSKFKTYMWDPSKSAPTNELTNKQIKETIDSEFAKKGLTKTDAASADLYIGYQAGAGTEKQFTSCNAGWVCFTSWYCDGCFNVGRVGAVTTGAKSTINKGQLVLFMYEHRNHGPVWCGIASKALDPKAKPDKQQKHLEKAVAKLIRNYPPPKK